ncbi:MAG: hypothetical protein AAGI71_04550 [Bacteroidota bacterium]
MRPPSRTYRLASFVLLLAFGVTVGGPIMGHLCAHDASAAHGMMHGSEAMADMTAPHDAEDCCCGPSCPGHGLPPEPRAEGVCCLPAPPVSAEAVVTVVNPVPTAEVMGVVSAVQRAAVVPGARGAVMDTGPPPSAQRPHLLFSVLLI